MEGVLITFGMCNNVRQNRDNTLSLLSLHLAGCKGNSPIGFKKNSNTSEDLKNLFNEVGKPKIVPSSGNSYVGLATYLIED